MKILFFGLGSIGKKHAKLIKDNFNYDIYEYRYKKDKSYSDLDIKEVYDLKDIDNIKPDVAFITSPTNTHIEYATYCAKRGINLFIEKPISDSDKGLSDLINLIKKNSIKTYVAYCLRFHPAIIWLKKNIKNKPIHITVNVSSYFPGWIKGMNPLKNFRSSKKTGGGVILDLSHEIDYLYYLFGDVNTIKVNSEKVSNITNDSEDFADVLIKFKNGLFCNLHMNFMSHLEKREIILDFKDKTIVADLILGNIIIMGKNKKIINLKYKRDEMYLKQLIYFFDNLKKPRMMNDLYDAMEVFRIIMDIKRLGKQ